MISASINKYNVKVRHHYNADMAYYQIHQTIYYKELITL